MTQQANSKLVSDWAPVQGLWYQEPDSITFLGFGAEESAEPGVLVVPQGVALSSAKIANGHVKANITLPQNPAGCLGQFMLGFSSWESRCIFVGLGGNGPAYSIVEHSPGIGWRNLKTAGHVANLKGNHSYALRVGLDGQRLTLNVEGIQVLDHVLSGPVSREQLGLYALGQGAIKFDSVEVSTRAYSAFVVMQFTDQFNDLHQQVIRPVCGELGIEAYRASDIYRPGVIFQDILQGLDESSVVIADVTPPNPNVFYELGYSHALKKPVILLAERETPLPFDVSGFRVIFYDNTIGGKSAVEADLRRHLTGILGE